MVEISSPLRIVEIADVKENINPVWGLAKVLLKGNLEVICALEKAVQSTDYDTISVALVTFFRMYSSAQKLLQFFISKEINDTAEESTLFRGVSLATKMVSAFCMQEGQSYCKNILDPCLKMFCIDEVSIEVDPSKIHPGEDLETNQAKLLGVCKGLLNHITRSVEHCSFPLREMFQDTKQVVSKRFPEHHLRVVGGFYFLRFLCPALVCPEGFRLIPAPPAAKSRRSLILVSKILQNLANDVEFGEKESYMVPVNTFIKTNQTTMWTFLEQLSSPARPRSQPTFLEMKQDPLTSIHQCIQSHREKIGALLQKGGHGKIFDKLCKALGTVKVRRASNPPPLDVSYNRKRASSSLPPPLTSTPLSPTSSLVANLIPISSSPSHSLSSLLQLNLQPSLLPLAELTNKLQKLGTVQEERPELTFEKLDLKSDKFDSPREKSDKPNSLARSADLSKPLTPRSPRISPRPTTPATNGDQQPPPSKLSEGSASANAVRDIENELNKEMQEIQALRLALESGGMGLKERVETHARFVGLLQHLKVMLATYKELKKERGEDCETKKLDEVAMDGL